jgi:hypothetical protein
MGLRDCIPEFAGHNLTEHIRFGRKSLDVTVQVYHNKLTIGPQILVLTQ